MTLCRGTLLGPPPTGHVRRFIDSGVFVLPVGGPSRSLLEVRGAPWVALPALICSFEAASSRFKFDGNFVRDLEHLQAIESLEKLCFSRISEGMVEGFLAWFWHFFRSCLAFSCRQLLFWKLFYCQQYCQQEKVVIGILLILHCHVLRPVAAGNRIPRSLEKGCFSRISDDTLGSFLTWFWNSIDLLSFSRISEDTFGSFFAAILRPFRHEIRWCFTVSDVLRNSRASYI